VLDATRGRTDFSAVADAAAAAAAAAGGVINAVDVAGIWNE